MFASTLEYLRAELQWLDLLLHREILRLRACYQLSLDEFRGLYVSDEHVDALVARVRGEAGLEDAVALTRRALSLRAGTRRSRPSRLPWDRVAREFRLCEIEQDILLLAMAPEVHLKYETLYAYLHNDVTRKTPTCDLAARVLASSPAEALEVRRALMP